MTFRVKQIDHVELTVPDRLEAASWYERILGLEIIPEFQFWADDPGGPLMIGTCDGRTKLALFTGAPQGSQRNIGFHRVAFRVDGTEFLQFLRQLESLQLRDQQDEILTTDAVVNHRAAFSIYFCDPYKNQLELTTYDVESVRQSEFTGKTWQ